MHKIKKILAVVAAIAALTSVTASAEWVRSGYDTTDLNNIGKLYNEVVAGNYTSRTKFVPVEAKDIKWVAEGFESDWPHAGYDRLYVEGNRQQITRYNDLFPQWETRFADYFWELSGNHKIYQRQQTKVPGIGWKWDYSDDAALDQKLMVYTNREAPVTTSFKWYGVGPFDLNGYYVSPEVEAMYARFDVNTHEYKFDPVTKYITEGFFLPEKLSEAEYDGDGNFLRYKVSDAEIAANASSIVSKFLTGPSFRGDDPTKDVAAEYLKHGEAWDWDNDTLRWGGAQVSWTAPMYEMAEPYKQYQYLIVNGLVFDGRADLPKIFRYTGGKATPKVEWKYVFALRTYPYSVIEQKYVDGKPAYDYETGDPIYRVPTGEFANSYKVVTPTEVQTWLRDSHASVMIDSESRVDHDKGNYDIYASAAIKVNNY